MFSEGGLNLMLLTGSPGGPGKPGFPGRPCRNERIPLGSQRYQLFLMIHHLPPPHHHQSYQRTFNSWTSSQSRVTLATKKHSLPRKILQGFVKLVSDQTGPQTEACLFVQVKLYADDDTANEANELGL